MQGLRTAFCDYCREILEAEREAGTPQDSRIEQFARLVLGRGRTEGRRNTRSVGNKEFELECDPVCRNSQRRTLGIFGVARQGQGDVYAVPLLPLSFLLVAEPNLRAWTGYTADPLLSQPLESTVERFHAPVSLVGIYESGSTRPSIRVMMPEPLFLTAVEHFHQAVAEVQRARALPQSGAVPKVQNPSLILKLFLAEANRVSQAEHAFRVFSAGNPDVQETAMEIVGITRIGELDSGGNVTLGLLCSELTKTAESVLMAPSGQVEQIHSMRVYRDDFGFVRISSNGDFVERKVA